MRLLKFYIHGYKNLQNVTIDFRKSDGKTLVVGTNGSGKSNLIEVVSAIFSAMYNKDEDVFPSFKFELTYLLDERTIVLVDNTEGLIKLSYRDASIETDYKVVDRKDYDKYVPDHVIAVYSGEEKRLWETYYFKSYDIYNKQYMDGKSAFRPQKMIYLNYYYWDIIASILTIHEIEDHNKFITDTIGIEDVLAIHMSFDVSKLKRNRNKRAKQILEILNPSQKAELDVSLETYKQVREFCGYEPDMFYNMVVLTLYKDYKIITDLVIKCNNGIEIRELSEGEKKLLLIYGAINLLSGNNLYLLDEPDAHLHEGRKREIFEYIQQSGQSHFIVSSHSPTLTKLFEPNNVIMLDNANRTCSIHYGEVANTITKLTNGEWTYIDQVLFFERTRPLILVEGPGDVGYIRKAIDVLLQVNSKYNSLKLADVIHCGGASNIQRTINEVMDNLPDGKKIVAIYDRDEAGGDELKKAIGKGKDRRDYKTYRRGSVYYLKLPKTANYGADDFVIEDYFSQQLKKTIAQEFVDNIKEDLNSLPKDLRQKIKDRLYEDLDRYDKDAMSGFGVLLDKLCSILNGEEQVTEV